jgi:hypothetical protein
VLRGSRVADNALRRNGQILSLFTRLILLYGFKSVFETECHKQVSAQVEMSRPAPQMVDNEQ